MINSDTEQTAQTSVQVRPGCQHPTLGAIGGWEGAVLRSFNAGGVAYLDVEARAKTIAAIERRREGTLLQRQDRVYTLSAWPRHMRSPLDPGDSTRPHGSHGNGPA